MKRENKFNDLGEEREDWSSKKKRKSKHKRPVEELDAFNMSDTPILPTVEISAEKKEQPELEKDQESPVAETPEKNKEPVVAMETKQTTKEAPAKKEQWMPDISGVDQETGRTPNAVKQPNQENPAAYSKSTEILTPSEKPKPTEKEDFYKELSFAVGQEVVGIDKYGNPEPEWKIVGWIMGNDGQVVNYFLVKRIGNENQRLELTAERLIELQQPVTLETENEKKKTERPTTAISSEKPAPLEQSIEEELKEIITKDATGKEKTFNIGDEVWKYDSEGKAYPLTIKKIFPENKRRKAYFFTEEETIDYPFDYCFKEKEDALKKANEIKEERKKIPFGLKVGNIILSKSGTVREVLEIHLPDDENDGYFKFKKNTENKVSEESIAFSYCRHSSWVKKIFKNQNEYDEWLKEQISESAPNSEEETEKETIVVEKYTPADLQAVIDKINDEYLNQLTQQLILGEKVSNLLTNYINYVNSNEKNLTEVLPFWLEEKRLELGFAIDKFDELGPENSDERRNAYHNWDKNIVNAIIDGLSELSRNRKEAELGQSSEQGAIDEGLLDKNNAQGVEETKEAIEDSIGKQQTSAETEFWQEIDEILNQEHFAPQNKETYERKFLEGIPEQKQEPSHTKELSEKAKGLLERLANAGSAIERRKAQFFKGTLSFLSRRTDYQWTKKVSEGLQEWSSDYAAREKREIDFQQNRDKTKWQKAVGAVKIFGNAGKVLGLGFSLTYKLAMYGTMAATEAVGVAKRLRLDKEEVKFLDEATAYNEAWELYDKAGIGKKYDGQVTLDPNDQADFEDQEQPRQVATAEQPERENDAEKLREAYRQGLPEIIMKRFGRNNIIPEGLSAMAQDMMRKTVIWRLRWINDKIAALEKDPSIDGETRQKKINNLLWWNDKFLRDMDGMVGGFGAIDKLAYGLKTAEFAGKTASAIFITNTLKRSAMKTAAIVEHPELIPQIWHNILTKVSGPASVSVPIPPNEMSDTALGLGKYFSSLPSQPDASLQNPFAEEIPPQAGLGNRSPLIFAHNYQPPEPAAQPQITNLPEILSKPASADLQEATSARGYLSLAANTTNTENKLVYLQKAADMEITAGKTGEADSINKQMQNIINAHRQEFNEKQLGSLQRIQSDLENKIQIAEIGSGTARQPIVPEQAGESVVPPPQSADKPSMEKINFSGISGKRGLYGGAEQFVQKFYAGELDKFAPNSSEYRAALVHHADRIKDLLAEDIKNTGGRRFGLEHVTNPDKISAEQFNKIKWDEVQKAVEHDKIFHRELKPEEVENIVKQAKTQSNILEQHKSPSVSSVEHPAAVPEKITVKPEDLGADKNTSLIPVEIPAEHNLLPNEQLMQVNDKFMLVGVGDDKKPFSIMEFPQGTSVYDAIQKSQALNVELKENNIPLAEAPALVEFSGKNNIPLPAAARHHFWLKQEKMGLGKERIADIIRLAENQQDRAALNELITGDKDYFPYEDYENVNVLSVNNRQENFENITIRYRSVGQAQENYDVSLFASGEQGRIALDGKEVAKFELKQAKDALKDPAGFVKKVSS